MTETDLSLVSTDALMLELASRHKGLLIVVHTDIDTNMEDTVMSYWGGQCLALGMAVSAQRKIEKLMIKDQEEPFDYDRP
jgi:hypothetical protein